MLPLADTDWMASHLLFVHPYPLIGWLGFSPHVLSMFIAAALMMVIFPKIARDESLVPTGARNFFEVILVFIRDEVAHPFLGHNTRRFIPVLWTFFFFILFCNLLGLVPLGIGAHGGHKLLGIVPEGAGGHSKLVVSTMATATGSPWVTGTLAAMAFIFWHGSGIWEQGLLPYIKNIVPPGLPLPLIPFLFVIECVGHVVKPVSLTIRLFANMTGGHAVLYGFIGLIFFLNSLWLVPISVMAGVGVYMLEIFVAGLQAYVFTFLVCVFLGAAVHPEH